MAIRVNLLAEALAAEDLRRRDPVKRALFAGALLVALMLVWSSSLLLEEMLAKNNLAGVQNDIQSHAGEFDQVTANLKKISDTRDKLGALQQLSDGRFLQGNLLNALQQITVTGVQMTRLRVDQNYIVKAGSPGQTNQFGVIPGKPPVATERIVLSLDAKDYSANPGDQVNKFKGAITTQAYFASALDKTNGVRLASLSSPQTGPDGRMFVLFTVECRYPDQNR